MEWRIIRFLLVEACIVLDRFSAVWSWYGYSVTLSLIGYESSWWSLVDNHVAIKQFGILS